MPTPRWFLITIAACAVVLTLALTFRLIAAPAAGRWEWVRGDSATAPGLFDRRTGEFCALVDEQTFTCFDRRLHRANVEHLDTYSIRTR